METNNWKVTTRTKYDSKKRAKRTNKNMKGIIGLMMILIMVFIIEPGNSSAIPTTVDAGYIAPIGETNLVSIFTYEDNSITTEITESVSVNSTSAAISSVPQQGMTNYNSETNEASNELIETENEELKKAELKRKKEEKRKKKLEAKRKKKVREKKRLERLKKKTYKTVPDGFGSVQSYMKWDLITSRDSSQYKLRIEAEHYNSKGMGMINGRFAIAVKPYYGDVGDLVNVEYENGEVLKAIIVEQKGHENEPGKGISESIYSSDNAKQLALGVTNKVHTDGSVIEFCVDGDGDTTGVAFSGYGGRRTVSALYPEYNSNIKGIYKVGNYWN